MTNYHYQRVISRLDEENAIKTLQEILRIDTTNPPGNELLLAKYISKNLNASGVKNDIVDLGNNRGNIIGFLGNQDKGKTLLLNGHLDVVPPGSIPWKYPPFEGIIKSGKIYGRGASDMKSGLAALVIAVCLLAEADLDLKGKLIFAGTAGEETESRGARNLLEKGYLKNVDAAIIAEPSNMKIFSATKGALWLKFTTIGKTAHGSMPEEGKNAIIFMKHLIDKLNSYQLDYKKHYLLNDPTLNIATINGGVKTNVVPDSCSITVDIRTLPGQNHQKIYEELAQIVKDLKNELTGFEGKVEIINDRPSIETSSENDFIQMSIETAKEVLDLDLQPQGVNYYTDGSVFVPQLKIPTLIFGPGDEKLAHQPDEYVEIAKFIDSIKFYIALILKYFS